MNRNRHINHGKDGTGWMRQNNIDTSPSPPLGELIGRLRSRNQDMYFPERTDRGQKHVGITNVELVSSYNWVNKAGATIIVPGKPPRWTPLKEPRQLLPDDPQGTYYRDPNAASFPKHPMEPAVVSVMRMSPECPGKLHLFACGSTMGNLLRFCRNSYDGPFRILVNVIGNVVHLVRRENSPTETIPDIYGFGHAFPEAYTSWDADVKQSKSHQKIIRYKLGGINALIRFEVDGYLPQDGEASPPGTHGEDPDPEGMASLLGKLAKASLSSSNGNVPKDSRLSVEKGGQAIPQNRVFDLKTRAFHKKRETDVIFDQQVPRLWVRQIPNFVLAFHKRGVFNDVEVHDVRRQLTEWERSHQFSIKSLVTLLQDIMRMAREHPDGKFELVYAGGGPLEIRKQLDDAGDMLSDKVSAEWERWLRGGRRSSAGVRDDGRDAAGKGAAVHSVGAEKDAEKNAAKNAEKNAEKIAEKIAEEMAEEMAEKIADSLGSDSDSDSGDLTACGPACEYCGKCSRKTAGCCVLI